MSMEGRKSISEEDELLKLVDDLKQLRSDFDDSKKYTGRHRCFINSCWGVTCFLTFVVFFMSVYMYVCLDDSTQKEFSKIGAS